MKCLALAISRYSFALIFPALLIATNLKSKIYARSPDQSDLNTLINSALEHNSEIELARREIEKSTGVRIRARSLLYPKAQLESRLEIRNQDLLKENSNSPQGWNDYWIIQLAFHHPLYSGGSNPRKIQIADLQLTNQFLSLKETTQKIIAQIKETYFTLLLRAEEIKTLENASAILQKEIQRQKALFEAGRSTRFNLIRTQVAHDNLQPELQALKIDLHRHHLTLAQLAGQSPLDPLPSYNQNLQAFSPPPPPPNFQTIIQKALSERAQTRLLDNNLHIATHQIHIERSALFPKIDAFAAVQTRQNESPQKDSHFFSPTHEFAIGLLGRWNLFDGFFTKGKIREARAEAQVTALKKQQWENQLKAEAQQITTQIQSLHQMLQNHQNTVALAEEALRLAQLSHEHGYATLLDVLQANVDLSRARINALQAHHQLLIAHARLDRLIGLPEIHIDPSTLKINQ